ncbi:MAG: STAS domain-containing protein [Desulfococcaceae bacterium]
MNVTVSQQGTLVRMVLDGDIDEHGAETMNTRFQELGKESFSELVLDFRKVKYIGSSGIGQLILFYKETAPLGKKVRIENVSKEIYDLLLDLDINKVISIHQ